MATNPYLDAAASLPDAPSAAPSAPSAPNPYLAAAQGITGGPGDPTAHAALAVGLSSDQNADEAANNLWMAKKFGTTPAVVSAFPQEFKARMAQERAQDVLSQAPVLTKAISSNPPLAAAVHPELPQLSAIEKAINALGQGFDYLTSFNLTDPNFKGHTLLGDVKQVAMGGNRAMAPAAATVLRAFGAPFAGIDALAGTNLESGPFNAARYYEELPQNFPGPGKDSSFWDKVLETTGQTGAVIAQALLGGEATTGAKAAQMGTQTAWQAISAHLAHGTQAMMIPAAVESQKTYDEVIAAGGTPTDALKAGLASYTTTTMGGVIPFSTPGKLAVRLGAGAIMGPTQAEVSRQIMNFALPASMQQAPMGIEDLALSSLSGAVFGGMAGPHDLATMSKQAYDVARESYTKAAEADHAQRAMETLQKMGDIVQQVKLRETNPDAFHQLVAEMSDAAGSPTVFVEAKLLAEALDKHGVDAALVRDKMPDVDAQMREALQTEGSVHIPVEDYATHISGTELDKTLQPHLRVDENGPTFAEGQAFYQDQAEKMTEQAKKIAEDRLKETEFQASGKKVEDYIKGQLEQTKRFPTDVNNNYAKMWRAMFETTAARAKMLPHEMLERYQAEVRAHALPGGEGVMDQSSLHDLLAPMGQSKMIGDESPLKDYGDVKAFESDYKSATHRSIRYVKYDADGNPIGVLQFMTKGPRSKQGVIQNVFTTPEARRQGVASGLLRKAQEDFKIKHSDDLTKDGAAFKAADGKYYQVMAAPEDAQFNQSAKPGPDSPGAGVAETNKLGFWPALRVKVTGKLKLPEKAAILTGTNNKNAARQVAAIDPILKKFPKATESAEQWTKMMAHAFASDEVPIPPYAFIRDLNGSGSLEKLRTLTQGQIDDATHGFENAAEFRRAYEAGELPVETTGKLFMWSFLSRGVSPYTQESLFIDAFNGADPWIAKAARGEFTEADFDEYEKWAKSVAPKGSGQPGAGATHNLNAFGKNFLFKMGQKGEDGTSHLQRLHDMMCDPQQTGKGIRRTFATFGEGVGIDNKVVSFTLLVAGHPDVMVLDRVQIRQLWDDGRFNGVNLYDGASDAEGKKLAGSSLNSLAEGARGILVYEAIERGLQAKIEKMYSDLGRPQDASIGRYHWETWVADSQQEASHGTLGAILADAKGDDSAIARVAAKQGEYGAYEYGALYNRDADGTPWFSYSTPSGASYDFTVPAFRAFLADIKSGPGKVIPSKFKVSESGNGPWYDRPEVNREKLDERAAYWADLRGGTGEGQRALEQAARDEDAANRAGPGTDQSGGADASVRDRAGPDDQVLNQSGPAPESSPARTLLEIGKHEGLYQYPKSRAHDLEAIARDKSPDLQVTEQKVDQMDGTEKSAGVWDIVTPEGGYATLTRKGDEVWINVAGLEPGDSGSLIYDLAANYALNNKLKFVGDPAGVSNAAMVRRAENMLSSAVKYGTTDHLQPHLDQLKGNDTIPAMSWKDGDTEGNIHALVDATLAANDKLAPAAGGINYDPAHGRFADSEGQPVDGGDVFKDISDHFRDVAGPGAPGSSTLLRASLFRALLQGEGARRQVLDKVRSESGESGAQAGGEFDRSFYQEPGVARGQISMAGDITSRPSVISLFHSADLSTFLHESGHFFLEVYSDLASRMGADSAVGQDFQKALNWFGVKDVDTWRAMSADDKREFHENFARGFERYLMEGKAPSVELQSLFGRFRAWLVQAYRTLKGTNVELTDDMRGVFDRMLASEDAIKQAEEVRGMRAIFETKPEGMSDETWSELNEANRAATETAIADLQARGLRDMRWLSNAKDKAIRAITKQAAQERANIREEVTKAVDAQPAFAAKRELDVATDPLSGYKAEMTDWRAKRDAQPKDAREDWIKNNPEPTKPVIAKDAPRPPVDMDVIAEKHGFANEAEMLQAIHDVGNRKDVIEGMVDQRMLERHGDLIDPQSVERAAEAAIHNDMRAKFLATELKALAKATGSASLLAKAARQAADAAINAKKVGTLRPAQYEIAEGKTGRQARLAMEKGNTAEAAVQKRAQVLNNALAKRASEAVAQVAKDLKYLAKFDKPALRDKLDGEFLAQIDAIRASVDLRKNPSDVNRPQQSLEAWAKALRDNGYEPQISDWLAALRTPTNYKELTVEQFRGVADAVRSLEFIAREQTKIRRNGEAADLRDVVDNELIPRLSERKEKFSKADLLLPVTVHTDGYWKTLTHWLGVRLRMVNSDLKPIEFKFNKYDLHEIDGPMRQVLLDPILEANYRKVDLTKQVTDAAGKVGEELGKDWQESLYKGVPNTKLLDPDLSAPGKPVYMRINRGTLLGIARHVGNESNFDKLTKGYGWKPEDVIALLAENMTQKDVAATNAHWRAFDPLWAETEAMAKRLGGVPPPKIEARPFELKLKDGSTARFEGGYSPIDYDPIRSKLAARKGEFSLGPGDRVESMQVFKATTTSNGSLNARSDGYTDRVALDFHGAEARIRDTIHDLAYREALLDATKVINDSKFRDKFMAVYGKEEYQDLSTWLKDIRDMNATDPRTRNFDKAMAYTRQGVVLTGIGYRLSTVFKHGGAAALKSLGYLGTAEGAKYFGARVARIASGHASEDIAAAKEKFDEIRTRMLQMDRDYSEGTKSMYESETWREKNDRFGHYMVAWSDALSAVPTAWAAYDLARTSGVPESMGGSGKPMGEDEAVRYANSVVRQAHGSALEVTRSDFMRARGAKGFFGALYGFMNNTYGQMTDMLDKSVSGGHFKNTPAVAARLMATLIVPALWSQLLKEGKPDKDKGESWWHWASMAIAGEVAATAPFVRDAWSLIENARGTSVAPIQAINDVVNSGKDIWAEAHGKSTRLIQDLFNAVGEWAHIAGLGELGHILQHARDVSEGQKDPSLWHAAVGGKEERHK